MKRYKGILVITLFIILSTLCTSNQKQACIKSHEEKYYDSQGTSLYIITKNAGFLSQNGYKVITVCDEYQK